MIHSLEFSDEEHGWAEVYLVAEFSRTFFGKKLLTKLGTACLGSKTLPPLPVLAPQPMMDLWQFAFVIETLEIVCQQRQSRLIIEKI
jgi:hypothetical protein